MNKKDFTILLRAVVRAEMKPLMTEIVQTALAKEFKVLREALCATQKPNPNSRAESRKILSEDINIDELMKEEGLLLRDVIEQDDLNEVVMKKPPKLFKGENVFTEMLQQTVDEGYQIGAMQKQGVNPGAGGQTLVKIDGMPDRSDMVNAIGYGRLNEGVSSEVPGSTVVQIPQQTPDGKSINPHAIPDFLLKAMNKDYSKDLKSLKEHADKNRPGR